MVSCKVIGGIFTEDENGGDHKIIAVLVEKSDPKSKFFNNIADVNEHDLNCIKYFLRHYKDGETDKFIKIGQIYGKEEAMQILSKSYIIM